MSPFRKAYWIVSSEDVIYKTTIHLYSYEMIVACVRVAKPIIRKKWSERDNLYTCQNSSGPISTFMGWEIKVYESALPDQASEQLPQKQGEWCTFSWFSGIYTGWHRANQNNLRNLKYAFNVLKSCMLIRNFLAVIS